MHWKNPIRTTRPQMKRSNPKFQTQQQLPRFALHSTPRCFFSAVTFAFLFLWRFFCFCFHFCLLFSVLFVSFVSFWRISLCVNLLSHVLFCTRPGSPLCGALLVFLCVDLILIDDMLLNDVCARVCACVLWHGVESYGCD